MRWKNIAPGSPRNFFNFMIRLYTKSEVCDRPRKKCDEIRKSRISVVF
jgi:hypothetical protein